MDLTAMGKVGLVGWKGKVGSRVAEPISERTSLTKDQIEAIFGAIFLALAFWQFFKLARRVWRAGRGEDLAPG
jgi:dsRNA-specific ribonuclease